MWQALNDTFDTAGLMPHGYCILWKPTLLWTLVGSDLLVAASYFSIPFAIFYLAKKRPDIPHRWLFILFGLFIIACGITHLLDVLVLWQPIYWVNALVKAMTALLSLGTAIIIWLIMPSALQAPSSKQLEQAKDALQKSNLELEQRVQERTRDLNTLNARLQNALDERALLHDTIQHEKSLLRNIIDNIPDLIFIKDNQGIYVDCNKAFEFFFGASRYDIIGKTDYDFVDEETAVFFREKDQEVLNANQTKTNEEWVTYPNAEKICLETLKTPFRNHQGVLQGIIGISRNITERKQFEQQISTERQRLNNIIDGAHAGTWEWNILTGDCYFNDRWAEIFGYKLVELAPFNFETWSHFVHPDDLKISNRLLDDHLAGNTDYYQCEVRMMHKEGFWIWIADHGRVVSWTADGKPWMMSGTHLDISKRKNAEEKLRESEERIRLLLDASSFGIWGLDTEGCVTFVNRATTEMLGYHADELIGQNMHEIIHYRNKDGSDYLKYDCPMTATYQDGYKRKVSDEVFWRKDGTSFQVEYTTHPVYKNDALVGAVVSFEDITEREQIASRTKQYESIVQSSDDAIISN